MFQSLIGILMNCNSWLSWGQCHNPQVSIPNRDFDELQSENDCKEYEQHWFQSLIGILMNCNVQIYDLR